MRWMLLILLMGCYGPKKAQKAIDKAYKKQPDIVALNAAKWFPIKADSIEFIRWREEVRDSITLIHDTLPCERKTQIITRIKEMIRKTPPVYRIDSAVIYGYEDRLYKMRIDRDKYKQRFSFFWKAFALSIILLLLSFAYIIRRRK